jgi:hypothetical protein
MVAPIACSGTKWRTVPLCRLLHALKQACSIPYVHTRLQAKFGAPGSPAFEAARHNFIVSEAGYAVASYLLQVRVCEGPSFCCCRYLCEVLSPFCYWCVNALR